jgi:hypothetical protein
LGACATVCATVGLGWGGEERIEALSGLVFAARDKVPVAVPRLADIAVTGPGGDLLPVKTGGDEVGDRASIAIGLPSRRNPTSSGRWRDS